MSNFARGEFIVLLWGTNKVCSLAAVLIENAFYLQIQKQIGSPIGISHIYCEKCFHYGHNNVYAVRSPQYRCKYSILGIVFVDDSVGYFVHDFRKFEKCYYCRCYPRVGIIFKCTILARNLIAKLIKLNHSILQYYNDHRVIWCNCSGRLRCWRCWKISYDQSRPRPIGLFHIFRRYYNQNRHIVSLARSIIHLIERTGMPTK